MKNVSVGSAAAGAAGWLPSPSFIRSCVFSCAKIFAAFAAAAPA